MKKQVLPLLLLLLLLLPPLSQAQGMYYAVITITNRAGVDLYGYQVRVFLDSATFNGWDKILYSDGSDIYFLDENGNPLYYCCLLYTSPSPRDLSTSRMPSSA